MGPQRHVLVRGAGARALSRTGSHSLAGGDATGDAAGGATGPARGGTERRRAPRAGRPRAPLGITAGRVDGPAGSSEGHGDVLRLERVRASRGRGGGVDGGARGARGAAPPSDRKS